MKRPYVFVILFICMTVFQSIVFFYVMNDYEKERRKYVVTQKMFVDAVQNGVSNFLFSLAFSEYESGKSDYSTSVEMPSPQVVFVDQLATWENYFGKISCLIDGIQYTVGDFSPYGRIERIVSNRVYCLSSNSVLIVRGRAPLRADVPDPARKASPARENGAL